MRWLDPTAQLPENIAIILSQILALDVGLVQAVWNDLLSGVAYRSFRSGKSNSREITVPNERLDRLQKAILTKSIYKAPISSAAFGSVPGRSARDAAAFHFSQTYSSSTVPSSGKKDSDVDLILLNQAPVRPQNVTCLKLDVHKAFQSVRYRFVSKAFWNYLRHDLWLMGCRRSEGVQVAAAMAILVTMPVRTIGGSRCLPTGAPTSTAVFNLVMLQVDTRILSRFPNVRYTRYVDDMTLSGIQIDLDKCHREIRRSLANIGLNLNQKKTQSATLSSVEIHGFVNNLGHPIPSSRLVNLYAAYICRQIKLLASPNRAKAARNALVRLDGLLNKYYPVESQRPSSLLISSNFLQHQISQQIIPHMDLLWP